MLIVCLWTLDCRLDDAVRTSWIAQSIHSAPWWLFLHVRRCLSLSLCANSINSAFVQRFNFILFLLDSFSLISKFAHLTRARRGKITNLRNYPLNLIKSKVNSHSLLPFRSLLVIKNKKKKSTRDLLHARLTRAAEGCSFGLSQVLFH